MSKNLIAISEELMNAIFNLLAEMPAGKSRGVMNAIEKEAKVFPQQEPQQTAHTANEVQVDEVEIVKQEPSNRGEMDEVA